MVPWIGEDERSSAKILAKKGREVCKETHDSRVLHRGDERPGRNLECEIVNALWRESRRKEVVRGAGLRSVNIPDKSWQRTKVVM
nr:hypothetical protein CFP56_25834 [Quercus suber]